MAERPGLRPDEQTEIPFRRRQNAPRRQFSGSLRRVAVFGPYRSASDGQVGRRSRSLERPGYPPRSSTPAGEPLGGPRSRSGLPVCTARSRSIRSRRRFGSPAERASLATGRGESRTRPSSGGLGTLSFSEDERNQGVGGARYAGNRQMGSGVSRLLPVRAANGEGDHPKDGGGVRRAVRSGAPPPRYAWSPSPRIGEETGGGALFIAGATRPAGPAAARA